MLHLRGRSVNEGVNKVQDRTSREQLSTRPQGGELRNPKILVVTLAMTLLSTAPAFATVLDDTKIEFGPEEDDTLLLDHEFMGETEVKVGSLDLTTGS